MFDDTNGYGSIPDALPNTYGYADRQAPTVHQNMETAVSSNPFDRIGANQMVVASNSAAPDLRPSYGGMQAGPVVGRNPHAPMQGQVMQNNAEFGAAAARARGKGHPILTDEARSLEYRVYDGRGGYKYRQYEDGRYAITRQGKDPSGKLYGLPPKVQQNVPFNRETSPKAFDSIRAEVEEAIGPFPGSAGDVGPSVEIKPGSKPKPTAGGSKKKSDKDGAQTETSGGGGGGFQASSADTKEVLPPDAGEEDAKDGAKDDKNWFMRSTLGVPHWGWVAGVVVVGAGAGYYLYSSSSKKPAAAGG